MFFSKKHIKFEISLFIFANCNIKTILYKKFVEKLKINKEPLKNNALQSMRSESVAIFFLHIKNAFLLTKLKNIYLH